MKFLLTALGRTGAGPMYAFEMARALSKENDVLCIVSSDAENINVWRDETVRNHRFQIAEIGTYTGIVSFIFQQFNIFKFRKIRNVVAAFAPDVIYSPFGHFWDKYAFNAIKCKYTVKTVHDVSLHEGERGWKHQFINKWGAFRADKCVILSETFKSRLAERSHYSENDIIVIPHATFNEYSNNKILDLETNYGLMFFGRQVKYKGLSVMLEAMPAIIARFPNIKLYIVGKGDLSEYADSIDRLKDNIVLYNRWIKDSEVADFFKNVDIAVLPYTDASQSGVIPLANSFGKPSIASDLGGLPAQILADVTGYVIPPKRPDVLAEKIISLYSNQAVLVEMKKNSWNYASKNTWDVSAKILMDALFG